MIKLKDRTGSIFINPEYITSIGRARNGNTVIAMAFSSYPIWCDQTPDEVHDLIIKQETEGRP